MSASTPPGTTSPRSEGAAALPRTALSRRPRRRALPAWWLFSVLLHALFFASLLLVTPAGRDFLDRVRDRSAIPDVSSDRLEEISRHLQDLNELELQARLAALQDIQRELEAIRDETFQEFDRFAASQVEGAAEAVARAQAEARQAQREAAAGQGQARRAQDPAADAARRAASGAGDASAQAQQQARDAQQRSREAQDRAQQAQNAAEGAMERAVRTLGWVNAVAPQEAQQNALREQDAAKSAQAAASQAQGKAQETEQEAARARERLAAEAQRLEERARKAAEERGRRDEARTRLEDMSRAAEAARAKAAGCQEPLKRATELAAAARAEVEKLPRNADARREAEARAKAAEEQRRQADAEARRAEAEEKKADRERKEAEGRLQRAEAQLARAEDEAQKARQARDDRERELNEKLDALAKQQDEARKAQDAAAEAQQRAAAAHEAAIEAMAKWLRETGQLSRTPLPETAPAATLTWQEMRQLDAYALYRRAMEAETAVAETYKAVRAAELGMLRKMPLAEALKNTDVAKPVRPDMDRQALTGAARTADALERHKAAMKDAVAEADKMVELAQSMREAALALRASGGEGLSVQVAHAGALEKAAAENPDQKAVDLTRLMGAGGGGDSDRADSRLGGAAGGGRADRSRTHPPLETNTPGVLPGRLIASDGQPASWMYVDSWYVIGPWPNPGRVNIDKKYPPETVVDLDAVYPGADGRLLRWRYVKSPQAMLVPPDEREYMIYYAYTEVFCEEARDLWVAIGSDDKSKIWLNDQVIWESVPWHKPWHINEGFRKVRLQPGRNRILYRLENGWHSCALSLVLCTREDQ